VNEATPQFPPGSVLKSLLFLVGGRVARTVSPRQAQPIVWSFRSAGSSVWTLDAFDLIDYCCYFIPALPWTPSSLGACEPVPLPVSFVKHLSPVFTASGP
jgi:hypothetical protein